MIDEEGLQPASEWALLATLDKVMAWIGCGAEMAAMVYAAHADMVDENEWKGDWLWLMRAYRRLKLAVELGDKKRALRVLSIGWDGRPSAGYWRHNASDLSDMFD